MRRAQKSGKRKGRTYGISVFLILAGLGVLMAAAGFHPEDSLLFSTNAGNEYHHFLGAPFAKTAAFLVYFLGRGVFLFALILMYDGYILLRKIKKYVKAGYILLGAVNIVLCITLFAAGDTQALYRGGGLFGRFIVQNALQNVSPIIIKMILYAGLTAGLFTLFRFPLLRIYRLVKKEKVKFAERQVSRDQNPDYDKDYSVETPFEGKKRAALFRRNMASKKRRKFRLFIFKKRVDKGFVKPPLIQKVVFSGSEAIIAERIMVQGAHRPGNRSADVHYEKRRDGRKTASPGAVPVESDTILNPVMPSSDSGRALALHKTASALLKKSSTVNRKELEKETARKAKELERTLREFGIEARVTGITRGPVITRYELQPAPGVKLSRIVNLSNNIALSLSANGVRIEAPIPGRSAVGIEIPNDEREIVTLGDVIGEVSIPGELPLVLGKNISGSVVVSDLTTMPHLLIAGATGSGKSVCVNSLIMSLLFNKTPEEVRFIMMDPKMVELKIYNDIPHLLTEVVTDPREAAKALRWVLYEMENRYTLLDQNYVRNIRGYNQKAKEKLPYIVIIVDEFANLMAISQKDVEEAVVRLAAMSRAVGIHLIMATQRPSVDVITGLIKANFPYRIAFQVASKTDSRTILDAIGAEKLLGKGDMLFAPAGSMNIQRIQGAYISEDEVIRVVKKMKESTVVDYNEEILNFDRDKGPVLDYEDVMFDQAVEIVLKTKRASASFLQRRLKIGYNRAARIIELMEEKGIIGPPRGSKPRDIYIDSVE